MTIPSQRCLDCLVRDVSLCAVLRDDEIDRLSAMGRRRVFAAGSTLCWAGDNNIICANVVRGTLKATITTADGREQIVGLMFAGDFVGEPYASEAGVTITAVTEADLCIFPRGGFEGMLDDHPRMQRALLARTMESLNDARARLLSLTRRDARERIAGFLFDLAERSRGVNTGNTAQIDLPLSRADVADLLGLTIETVSRQLAVLKAAGVIDVAKGARGVRVLDIARLQVAANSD